MPALSQAMLVGDSRKFISALVTLKVRAGVVVAVTQTHRWCNNGRPL